MSSTTIPSWTLHETPYGRVAATVNSLGTVHIEPAFALVTRYPDSEELRYTAPHDELHPYQSTSEVPNATTNDLPDITNSTEQRMRAALRINGVHYEHARVTVEATAPSDYMRSLYGDKPYATAHSSYLTELTTSARAKLEAAALELYPTIATPVRVAQAKVNSAQYQADAADRALAEANLKAKDAFKDLLKAKNALHDALRTENSTESE